MTKKIQSKEFWKDIVYKNGKLDEKQVLKELEDFYFIMQEVPQIYSVITGGLLSKLMYKADTILGFLEDDWYEKTITQDDLLDMVSDNKTLEDLTEALEQYFHLPENAK